MPRTDRPTDPYASPSYKHGAGGALVRVAIVAALIGAAAWGYVTLAQRDQQAAVTAPVGAEVADASDYATPEYATPEYATPEPDPALEATQSAPDAQPLEASPNPDDAPEPADSSPSE